MGVPADGSIRAFRSLIREVIWYSIGSWADSADSKASEETRRAELVDGIARDFHKWLAPVLADAEPATGEFARGSSPDEDSKRIKVPALRAARGLTHVGQD